MSQNTSSVTAATRVFIWTGTLTYGAAMPGGSACARFGTLRRRPWYAMAAMHVLPTASATQALCFILQSRWAMLLTACAKATFLKRLRQFWIAEVLNRSAQSLG